MLEPKNRRRTESPSKLTDEIKDQAVAVRAALEASGLDHGPISEHDKMRAMGLQQVPSMASLARIFRETGVARVSPLGWWGFEAEVERARAGPGVSLTGVGVGHRVVISELPTKVTHERNTTR